MFSTSETPGKIDLSITDEITIASPSDPLTEYGAPVQLLDITSRSTDPIFVSFNLFRLENSVLMLYTGESSDTKTEIAQWTGSSFPNDITSYRPYMWIEINATGPSTTDGFIMTLRSQNESGKPDFF